MGVFLLCAIEIRGSQKHVRFPRVFLHSFEDHRQIGGEPLVPREKFHGLDRHLFLLNPSQLQWNHFPSASSHSQDKLHKLKTLQKMRLQVERTAEVLFRLTELRKRVALDLAGNEVTKSGLRRFAVDDLLSIIKRLHRSVLSQRRLCCEEQRICRL